MRTIGIKTLLRILGFITFAFSGLSVFFGLMGVPAALISGLLLLAISVYLSVGAPQLVWAIDRFQQAESIYEPGQAFTQRGGIRCGRTYWFASNSTSPFAHLRVSREALVLSVSIFGLGGRTFTLPRTSIQRLSWRRGLFSLGLKIEHDMAEFPKFILFWVSNREALAQALSDFGYNVSDATDR